MPGRTGDRTWTHGQRDSTLRNHRLDECNPVARLDDPTPEELRECIRDGHCWWCGKTGWKSLSGHTSRAHGITADELRDLAGLFKHNPTCTPELTLRFKDRPNNGKNLKFAKHPKGYKIQFNKAGRKHQDEVKTAILLANSNDDQRRNANKIRSEKYRKYHPCPVCGKIVPFSIKRRVTCSPECRKVIRQETALSSLGKLNSNPVLKKQMNLKVSETRKRLFAEGKLVPYQTKPHPCPVCGKIIPTARPRLCSSSCRSIVMRDAQLKARDNRNLKVTLAERLDIIKRFQQGESSSVIAKQYSISPRYVRLLGKCPRQ